MSVVDWGNHIDIGDELHLPDGHLLGTVTNIFYDSDGFPVSCVIECMDCWAKVDLSQCYPVDVQLH